MKLKQLTYLCIFGLVASFIIYKKKSSMENSPRKQQILRIGASYLIHDMKAHDPVVIRAAGQILFTDALFSKLLDFNEAGEITSGLATKYEIKNKNEILFTIRDDFTTIDGFKVTADDVAFSLKRLVLSKSPFAKHFEDLIVGCADIKSPLEDCEGISARGEIVVLRTKIYPDLFLESLTSAAFSVVPKQICAENQPGSGNFEIVDFRNTSGPYYFKEINEKGHIVFDVNPKHYSFHPKMPTTLEFYGITDRKKSFEDDALADLMRGEIDFVPTSGYFSWENKDKIVESHPEIQVHVTYPIKSMSGKFTLVGRLKPIDQRLAIVKKMREWVLSRSSQSKNQNLLADQYINKPGFGSLPKEKVDDYLSKVLSADTKFTGAGFVIQIPEYISDLGEQIKKFLPDIKITEPNDYKVASTDRVASGEADIVLTSEMPGITESFSMISWAIHSRTFAMTEEEGKAWLTIYSSTSSFEERKRLLEQIHYKSIAIDPTIIPMYHVPMFAFIRKPWRMHFSKVHFNTAYHLIRYED